MGRRWLLGVFFLVWASCTNPEVNFPDEEAQKETKKTETAVYQTPTLLVYEKSLGPVIFYPLMALAQSNSAQERFFFLSPQDEKSVVAAVKRIRQIASTPPTLIGVKVSLSPYWDQIRSQIQRVILIDSEPLQDEEFAEKISIFPEVKKEEEAQALSTESSETEKKESSVEKVPEKNSFLVRQEMKNYAFLLKILNLAGGKTFSQSQPLKQELLLLKGIAPAGSKITVITRTESGKEKESVPVAASRTGFFSALVIDSKKEFEVQFSLEAKIWRARFSGLFSTYPFFEFAPPEGLMEIRSYFTPISLEGLPLPEGVTVSEEIRKNPPSLYRVIFIKGEKPDLAFSGNEARITYAGDFSGVFKWQNQEFSLKADSVLFLLD